MIFVHALGTAQIDAGTARVKPTSIRRFALLLHLAAEPGRRVSRSTLHELVCPDQGEKNARHTLRELLYQLRQAKVPLIADTHGVELLGDAVRSDYGAILQAERPDSTLLVNAQGGFLPSYAPTHSEAFTEWYESFRARVTFDLCKALVREIARAKTVVDWATTERAARACLALDALNEEATLALAETLAVSGAKTQAVALLDSYMSSVGTRDSDLRVSAAILRRRIGENHAPNYSTSTQLPFVGRADELEFMQTSFRHALEGDAQCIVLHGEPGVGKSRLIDEFSRSIRLTRTRVERLAAQPGDADRPLGALIELIPRLLELPGALGCRPESMQWLKSLIEIDGATERAMPDVAAYRTTRAVADIIDAITSEQPLVLLIEDAHWLDTASLRFALRLCKHRAPRRLFVVVTSRHRVEDPASAGNGDGSRERAVLGLDANAASCLVDSALRAAGLRPTPDDVSWICGLSLGNPLFIATSAAEYARRRDRAAVPESLTELISTRLVGLSDAAMTILGTIVLFGKLSSVDRLCRALDIEGLHLLNAVHELERASLVLVRDFAIVATHALVSEAFLRQCSRAWLLTAHRQIAAVLTDDFADSSTPSLLWECALHWVEAGHSDRAREFLIRCADHAAAIGRPDAEANILLRALKLDQTTTDAIGLARRVMIAAHDAGDPSTILVAADALREMNAQPIHDDLEIVELWARFRFHVSTEEIEARLAACVTGNDVPGAHRMAAATFALKYADTHGRLQLARIVCESFAIEKASCEPHERFEHLMLRALVQEDTDAALRHCQQMTDSLDNVEEWARTRYLMNAALTLARCGSVRAALAVASRLVDETKRLGGVRLAVRASVYKAVLLYDLGRDTEADAEFAFAERLAYEFCEFEPDLDFLLNRIDIALFQGKIDIAAASLERFVEKGIPGDFQSRWIQVFGARIRQLRGEWLSDSELGSFSAEPMIGPMPGLCDLEIATVVIEWTRRGFESRAVQVLNEYAKRRRWRGPYSRCLQIALSDLGHAYEACPAGYEDLATASR